MVKSVIKRPYYPNENGRGTYRAAGPEITDKTKKQLPFKENHDI